VGGALMLLFAVFSDGVARAEDQGPARKELAKLHDAVVETIEQNFFDVALLRQIDWRAHADAARPTVLAAASTDEAVRRINGLLSELKTSHTALFTPDDYEYYALLDIQRTDATGLMSRRFWGAGGPYYPGIGVFTRQVDARHLVDGVLEGSPAARAGLKYGDEIMAVDDTPYSPIAAFREKIGRTVALTVRRHAESEPERLEIVVVPLRPTAAFSAATMASARVIEANGQRAGYVHIWASHDATSLGAALARIEPDNLAKAPGSSVAPGPLDLSLVVPAPLDFLIVDMRGRVGGSMAVAGQYLDILDGADRRYWGDWNLIKKPGAIGRLSSGAPHNPSFRGRSALLIDHHTRSAAEIMAYGYKRGAFGLVVGTPTAGAVSSGALFVMPGDLLLYVAVSGLDFSGRRLEGAGVQPDLRVERALPYAAGADPVLDAAVAALTKQAVP
jgi:carboxyl-terminal processing protease